MAVTLPTALQNTIMNAIDDAVNAGSGAGTLEIGTTGMGTVLSTITLSDPAFGASSNGVITLNGVPLTDGAADASGEAAAARIRDSDANDVVTGLTVGEAGSGADIILDEATIQSGQTVTLDSGTITHG